MSRPRGGADGAGVTGFVDDIAEFFDRAPFRTFERRARPRIERDQIDFGGDAAQQAYQLLGVCRAVIDAFQHNIFEGDTARIANARDNHGRLAAIP